MILSAKDVQAVCETQLYYVMCMQMNAKYADKLVNGGYPEEYWTEFNQRFDEIARKLGLSEVPR